MNDSIKFKHRLKDLRKEYSMTQQDLANKIGIVRTAIANYETGRTIPDTETISLIAKIFNTTTDYLLGNSDIRNPYHNSKDEDSNDLSKSLEEMKKKLMSVDTLMFDGVPADEDQLRMIYNAIEMGEAYARQRAKEKFTPKKYRK